MRPSTNFVLLLAALLFILLPQAALAGATNCPKEPTRTPITDGEVFAGSNCTIHSVGDIDEFTFSANNGDTYQLALALSGALSYNVCLTLYDPKKKPIKSGCTSGNTESVIDQALTVTGSYTIEVYEPSNGVQNYALSLERLYPFPPNEEQIKTLGKVVDGDIFAPTDSNAFVFSGATTGTYEVTANLSGALSYNVCVTVYSPNGTLVAPSTGTNPACTSGNVAAQLDFTPTQAGQYLEFLEVQGNLNGTQEYTLEVSCLLGDCPSPYPTCTLVDAASYNATSGILAMDFTVGNKSAATWNAWLNSQSSVTSLFSESQPITNPPKAIAKTTKLSPKGTVGVLSTLTTPTSGIICSSFVTVNTGTP
jgi:hypothetical protein